MDCDVQPTYVRITMKGKVGSSLSPQLIADRSLRARGETAYGSVHSSFASGAAAGVARRGLPRQELSQAVPDHRQAAHHNAQGR